eukprot:665518-Prorocentrum_minimum.AAC.1
MRRLYYRGGSRGCRLRCSAGSAGQMQRAERRISGGAFGDSGAEIWRCKGACRALSHSVGLHGGRRIRTRSTVAAGSGPEARRPQDQDQCTAVAQSGPVHERAFVLVISSRTSRPPVDPSVDLR